MYAQNKVENQKVVVGVAFRLANTASKTMAIAMWLKNIRCLRNSCLRRNTLWDTLKTSGRIPTVKVGCNTKGAWIPITPNV